MTYFSTLPLTAFFALSLLTLLVYLNLLPPGIEMLTALQVSFSDYFYWMIGLIILLESIVYVGFYFPGQFFAVALVVMAKPQWDDIVLLTVAMVIAATLGSAINYSLGRKLTDMNPNTANPKIKLKRLLLAMIHINSLAFFMFSQGANRGSLRVIAWAGLLNMPYYLLLILATSLLSEQVMLLAENTWLLLIVIGLWLAVALYLDNKKRLNKEQGTS
ncbi:MAG: membrane-associated protein [Paraglaciecola sp.]|jgi:membrane-associated protein